MKIIVDILLVLILAAGFILGWKRGLIKTLAKPVKIVAVWACSIKFCADAARRFIVPLIQKPVTEKLSVILREKCAGLTAQTVSEDLPTILKMTAGIFNIDIKQVAQDSGDALIERLAETFTQPLVYVVAIVISFILLLIVCNIVFSLLLWLLNGIFHTKPLSWLNRALGVVFGAAFAFIIAWLVSMIVGAVFGSQAFSSLGFEGGAIFRFFKEYHPLDLLLGF